MGNKHTNVKVRAKISVLGTTNTVDGLKMSYERNSCFGGRRVVATFTFPKGGWQQVSPDILQNSSSKGVNVPLEKLYNKDGGTSVRIICLAGSVPVYKTQMALADLLGRLRSTMRGGKALLLFSLTGGTKGDGEVHAFTALFCNGRRCGGAPRVEAPHRPLAEGGEEAEDGEGLEDSPGLRGDGLGLDESPGVKGDDEGVEDSPGPGGDGRGLDDSPGLAEDGEELKDSPGLGGDGQGLEDSPDEGQDEEGQDVAPGQEEGETLCHSAPQEGAGDYGHYVATPYGSGGQGRGGLRNTLRICAVVVANMLMLYNVWLEWNKTS